MQFSLSFAAEVRCIREPGAQKKLVQMLLPLLKRRCNPNDTPSPVKNNPEIE